MTSDTTEIQRDYNRILWTLYANKLDNLENKFLDSYDIPRLNHRSRKPDRPATSIEIERVIKNLSENKYLRADGYIGELYQTFNDLIPILLKLFQNIEEEGMPPTHYMTQHYSERKTRYDTHKNTHTQTKFMPVSVMSIRAKILHKNIKLNITIH